jgi:hypothetical protein
MSAFFSICKFSFSPIAFLDTEDRKDSEEQKQVRSMMCEVGSKTANTDLKF